MKLAGGMNFHLIRLSNHRKNKPNLKLVGKTYSFDYHHQLVSDENKSSTVEA